MKRSGLGSQSTRLHCSTTRRARTIDSGGPAFRNLARVPLLAPRGVSEAGGLWTPKERLEVLDSTAVCWRLADTAFGTGTYAISARASRKGPVQVPEGRRGAWSREAGRQCCSREPGR